MITPFKPSILLSKTRLTWNPISRTEIPFFYRGKDCHLQFIHAQETLQNIVAISCMWQGKPFQIYIPITSICNFLDPQLSSIDIFQLNDEFKDVIFSCLEEEICVLFHSFQAEIETEKLEIIPNISETSLCFSVTEEKKEKLISFFVSEKDTIAQQLFNEIYVHHKTDPFPGLALLKFPFHAILSTIHLSLQELRSLRIGDIILSRLNENKVIWTYDSVAIFTRQQEQQFLVEKIIMDEENQDLPVGIIPEETVQKEEVSTTEEVEVASDNEESSPAIDPQFSVNNLPVKISFEAGQKMFTVDELQQIHEGYTFDLEQPLDATQVQILANGQCIGQGEWVQIDEHLGVRITHLNTK